MSSGSGMYGGRGPTPPKKAGSPRAPNHVWKSAFLEVLRQTGNVSLAAQRANIHRPKVYEYAVRYPAFRQEWKEALEEAADRMEAEALRRGVTGVEKPVFGSTYSADGKPRGTAIVGTIREYSDTLLIFMLKAARPEKYRDNYHLQVDGRMKISTESEVDQALADALAEFAAVATESGEAPAGLEAPRPPEGPL